MAQSLVLPTEEKKSLTTCRDEALQLYVTPTNGFQLTQSLPEGTNNEVDVKQISNLIAKYNREPHSLWKGFRCDGRSNFGAKFLFL